MNKQIIIDQCEKIKDIVTEATVNEEEARKSAESYKNTKELNTQLLSELNSAKDIYWELERTLRIIEIDKEYDNTGDELENLKIRVKDLITDLESHIAELKKYDSVKESVDFYQESIKDANDFIGNTSNNSSSNSTSEINFKDSNDEASNEDNIFNISNSDKINAEEETSSAAPLKEDNDFAFDFSSMYGFDEDETKKDTKQKVVDVTDFDNKEEKVSDQDSQEKDSTDDTNLNELNDLFNYLNEDNSFNA